MTVEEQMTTSTTGGQAPPDSTPAGGAPTGGAPGGQGVSDAGAGGQTPAATSTTNGESGGAASPSGDAAKTYDEEYVKSLREEAAKRRTEKAALEAKLKALEDEKLSDTERRDKRLVELETANASLLAQTRRDQAIAAAIQAGALVPESIQGMIPADADNIPAVVNEIKTKYPALFGTPRPTGTADQQAGGGGAAPPNKASMNDWMRGVSPRSS